MSYRLPRIEFWRQYYVDNLDIGAIASGACISNKFELHMVGESPWVNDYDIVLTQVDVFELGSTQAKRNYKLFLCDGDYSAAVMGDAFTTGLSTSEADVSMIKGLLSFSASYTDIELYKSVQYNREIYHRLSFSNASSATLYAQLINAGSSVTFDTTSKLLVICHFAQQ